MAYKRNESVCHEAPFLEVRKNYLKNVIDKDCDPEIFVKTISINSSL